MKINNQFYLKLSIMILLVLLFFISYCSPEFITDSGDGGDDVFGEDSYEPNNEPDEATTLEINVKYSLTISPIADIDYFRFLAEEGKQYRINMQNILGFEPELSLYDIDGISLIEMKNTNTYTDTYNWWGYDEDMNYNEDEKESIIFIAEDNDYYYISVKDIYDSHDYGKYDIIITEESIIGTVNDLQATPNESNLSIDLEWTSINYIDGYKLYKTSIYQDPQNPDYNDFNLIKTLYTNNYQDTNIELDTTYFYYVTAYIMNEEGDPSNIAVATLNINIGNTQNLVAVPNLSDLQIDLNWDIISDVQGYNIYRTDIPQNISNPIYDDFNLINTTNSNSYSDTNVQLNNTYYYYITGYILNQEGDPSNVDDAELLVQIDTINNLQATPDISNYVINIDWMELSNVDGYNLYRTEIPQDIYNPNYNDFTLLQTVTNNSYSDSNVSLNINYYYYVTGYFQTEEGNPSNVDDAELIIGSTQDLTATANQTTYEIDVSWTSITGVDGYNLYYSTTNQSSIDPPSYDGFSLLSSITNTSFSHSDIEYNTRYYYYVIGTVSGIEQGDASNVDFAEVTLDDPKNLIATPDPISLQINVDWDIIQDADEYYIYRTTITQDINNPNYQDFTNIATTQNNYYVDINIQPNENYYYYVEAVINNHTGLPSNVDDAMFQWSSFKPQSSLINASEGLTNKIQIKLMEKYSNNNILRYEIYRAENEYDDPSTFVYINQFLQSDPLYSTIDDFDVQPYPIYYFYCVRVVIDINGDEYYSDYSYFDSGVARN